MGILGIGVDIVKTQRIADIIRRRGSSRFAAKILSVEELRDWQDVIGSRKEAPFLAVRFSVKEAAYKALFPNLIPSWKDLTYKSFGALHPKSKPSLVHHPQRSSQQAVVGPIHVSVSHDGDYVVASVVVESPH